MKNLLFTADNLRITRRIVSLTPNQKRYFGMMSVEEMMYHANAVSQAIFIGGSTRSPGIKQVILRIIVLNLMQKLPMGKHSSRRFFSRDEDLEFNFEKNRLIATTREFLTIKKPLSGEHPVFGRLNHKQWGRFAWIHLDHHLRQFGV